MENHSLETEEGMHCSWCGSLFSRCECPAKLVRSIDKERAEANREMNELRLQLQAAREQIDSLQARDRMAAARSFVKRERMLIAFLNVVFPWHKRGNTTWYLEPEYVNVMFDAVFTAALLAARREVETREAQQSLCVHWLDQMFNFCPWCGIARASPAATQEPR